MKYLGIIYIYYYELLDIMITMLKPFKKENKDKSEVWEKYFETERHIKKLFEIYLCKILEKHTAIPSKYFMDIKTRSGCWYMKNVLKLLTDIYIKTYGHKVNKNHIKNMVLYVDEFLRYIEKRDPKKYQVALKILVNVLFNKDFKYNYDMGTIDNLEYFVYLMLMARPIYPAMKINFGSSYGLPEKLEFYSYKNPKNFYSIRKKLYEIFEKCLLDSAKICHNARKYCGEKTFKPIYKIYEELTNA